MYIYIEREREIKKEERRTPHAFPQFSPQDRLTSALISSSFAFLFFNNSLSSLTYERTELS